MDYQRCKLRASFGIALVIGIAGCSGSSGLPRLVPVEGKVLVDNKPLVTKAPGSCAIVFRPDAAKGNTSKHEPRAVVDAEGHYYLTTANRDGAPLGWYKVGVTATEPTDPKNQYAVPRSILPAKFADPEKSGLFIEVVENGGPYEINVSKK